MHRAGLVRLVRMGLVYLLVAAAAALGWLYNLHYHVKLVAPEVEKRFLDAIRCRNGNLDIVCGKVPQEKEAL